jgi:SSS family solute:Na+ symporter
VGLGGLVLAAAVAAMMSTASGALIAAATVARADVVPTVSAWLGRAPALSLKEDPDADVAANRRWVLGLGLVVIALAIVVQDVVAALTISYDILVGGLLVAILGGLMWRRGTGLGAGVSMAAGTLVTLGSMIVLEMQSETRYGGVYANEPIYFGLLASGACYVLFSLLSAPTDPAVMAAWDARAAGDVSEEVPVSDAG